jgi:biopolymer transport protein ExbB
MNQSYLDLIQQGGFIMMLLGICSVISLAIILERLINVRKNKFIQPEKLEKLTAAIKAKEKNKADELLKEKKFFLAKYLNKLLPQKRNINYAISNFVETSATQISEVLDQRLHVLLFIVQLSPLLGILGTVIGLTDAFLALGHLSGTEKFQFLSEGIGKALSTTIAGLIIAVYTMAGHYLIKYKNEKIVSTLEHQLEEFHHTIAGSHETK